MESFGLAPSSWKQLSHNEQSTRVDTGFIRTRDRDSKDWSELKLASQSGTFMVQLTAQRAGLF